jgi:hypothetical protein
MGSGLSRVAFCNTSFIQQDHRKAALLEQIGGR